MAFPKEKKLMGNKNFTFTNEARKNIITNSISFLLLGLKNEKIFWRILLFLFFILSLLPFFNKF